MVLEYGFSNPTGFGYVPNVPFGQYASSTTDVTTIPTWADVNPNPNFWFWFEYTTAKEPFIVIGDSISNGYNSTWAVAAWNVLATQNDWAVCIEGMVQFGSYANFVPGVQPYVYDMLADIIPNSNVVYQLGTNDLVYSNFATMKANALAAFSFAQKLSAKSIRAWTVPPQQSYADASGARLSWNADLRANYASYGLTAIYDAAAPRLSGGMADDADTTKLYLPFDSGDGTHPSVAGQAALAVGWKTKTLGGL